MDCIHHTNHFCLTFQLHPSQSTIYILTQKNVKTIAPISMSLLTPHMPRPDLQISKLDLLTNRKLQTYSVPSKVEESTPLPCTLIHQQNKDFINGYNIILNPLRSQIILTLPNALLCIWDQVSGNLTNVFQTHGKYIYSMSCARLHPISQQLFFVAMGQGNLYSIDLKNLRDFNALKSPQKRKLPKNVSVHDIWMPSDILESESRFLFLACTDGFVRVEEIQSDNSMVSGGTHHSNQLIPLFYNKNMKENQEIKKSHYIVAKKTLMNGIWGIDLIEKIRLLIACDTQGAILLFQPEIVQQQSSASSGKFLHRYYINKNYQLISVKFVKFEQTVDNYKFAVMREDGSFYIGRVLFKRDPSSKQALPTYVVQVLQNLTKPPHPAYFNLLQNRALNFKIFQYNISCNDFIQTNSSSNLLLVGLPLPAGYLQDSSIASSSSTMNTVGSHDITPKRILFKDISIYRLFDINNLFYSLPTIASPQSARSSSINIDNLINKSHYTQPYTFYLDKKYVLIAHSLSKGKKYTIGDLRKKIQKLYKLKNCEFRFMKYRPHPSSLRGDYTLIIQAKLLERVAVVMLSVNMGDILLSLASGSQQDDDDDEKVQIKLLRQFADGSFLGDDKNETKIAMLHHDFQKLTILKFESISNLKVLKQLKLEAPVRRLFSAPFRNGMTLFYEVKINMQGPTQIHSSVNIEPQLVKQDELNISKYCFFKFPFHDDTFNSLTFSYSGRFVAILTNLRVYILEVARNSDNKGGFSFKPTNIFTIQKEQHLNFISSGIWCGDQVFLFTSERYLHYLFPKQKQQQLLENGNSSNILLSLNQKNSVLAGVCVDRVILVSSKKKICSVQYIPINLEGIMLIGYLNLQEKSDHSDEIVQKLLKEVIAAKEVGLGGGGESRAKNPPILVQGIVDALKKYYKSNSANQLFLNGKIQPWIMDGFDIIKNLLMEEQSLNIQEMKQIIGESLKVCDLNQGDKIQRFKARLLNDFNKQTKGRETLNFLLKKALKGKESKVIFKISQILNDYFTAQFAFLNDSTKLHKFEQLNNNFNPQKKSNFLNSLQDPDKFIQNVFDNPITKIDQFSTKPWLQSIEQQQEYFQQNHKPPNTKQFFKFNAQNFGDQNFSLKLLQDESGGSEQIPSLHKSALSDYFGYPSNLSQNNKAAQQFMSSTQASLFQSQSTNSKNIEESKTDNATTSQISSNLLPQDIQPDNFDQEKYILFYWRCDQGKGSQLNDLSDFELQATIVNSDDDDSSNNWIGQLQDGVPIQFEDKWGRRSQPNCSVKLDIDSMIKLKRMSPQALQKLTEAITVEFWVLHIMQQREGDVSLFSVKAAGQNVQLIINFGNLALGVKSNKKIISNNLKDQTDLQELVPKKWFHISMVWNFIQAKIETFINTKKCGAFTLPIESRKAIRGSDWVFGSSLRGLMTQIRCWSINLNDKILRQNWKTPCSIVAEKKRKLRMKMTKKAPLSKPMASPQKSGLLAPPKKQLQSASSPQTSLPTPRGTLSAPRAPKMGLAPPKKSLKPFTTITQKKETDQEEKKQ